MLNIVVNGGGTPDLVESHPANVSAATSTDPLADEVQRLFGSDTQDARSLIWGPDQTSTNSQDTNAVGSNELSGPTTLNGIFTQAWWDAHWQELLFGGVAAILVIFGLAASLFSVTKGK